jgi:2-polyprenyl-3-methyl-5-hydroxy-6-metoxy-1,4-benzoquinol methylase
MAGDVIEPFERDVLEHGGYQYATTTLRSSHYAYKHFYDIIMATAGLDGKRVVDVGCGDGTYTARMHDETKAVSLLGLDPSPAVIQFARTTYTPGRPRLEFRCGYARDLIAEGAQFDLAVYGGVIHHVADPAREIADALRLAATVFFLEPNGSNPIVKFNERFSRYHVEHKEQSYRMGQLLHWINRAGGETVKAFYFGLVPVFCPDWLFRICSTLEPVVERLPLFRIIACGQVGILARRGPATPGQKVDCPSA